MRAAQRKKRADAVQELLSFAIPPSSPLSSLFDGNALERCYPFRGGIKPNAARGTSTDIYVTEPRNAEGKWKKKERRREEEINAERKGENGKKYPYRRGNEATLSDPLIAAGRFLRASPFQLAPRDLRLCIREHLVGERVLEILEIHSRRIESRLADNGVANERYLCRCPVTLWPKGRSFITHADASVNA